MTVREVIVLAATQLGIVDEVEGYLNNESMDGKRDTELLLTCFNLVENELALDYLPLYAEEEISSTGKVAYSHLKHSAVHILRVTDEKGNSLKFTLFPDCFKTQAGKVKIFYTYTPEKKEITEKSDFRDGYERMLSYGVASEYATAVGMYAEAAVWDKKYKDAIESAYYAKPNGRIRLRRWV